MKIVQADCGKGIQQTGIGLRRLDCRYQFNAREEEAEVLKTLQQKDVIQFYAKYLKPGSKQRSKLAVHVVGKTHAEELTAGVPEGVKLFRNPEALRASLEAYPTATATYSRQK